MSAREWFRGFFDEIYLEILRAQCPPRETRRQVREILRLARPRPGARILDVGCGYGRHALELARRGFEVVGVDLSPVMIREARRAANRHGATFLQLDMRRLPFEREFDLVLCLFSTFGYFSGRENAEALRGMVRALRPGGRLVVDSRNPEAAREYAPRTWSRAGTSWFVLEEHAPDARRRLWRSRWFLVRAGGGQVFSKDVRVRLYSAREWRRMLRRAGARRVRIFSSFRGSAFHPRTSHRMVLLADRQGP